MTGSDETRAPIASLTGVRAVAALWVVLHHLRPAFQRMLPDARAFHGVLEYGYLGVDLFAFLSGFLIAYQYGFEIDAARPRSVRRYVWLRAVRIFPMHWFTLGVLLVARLAIPGFGDEGIDVGRFEGRDFVQHAAMLHGWGVASHYAWNVPSWTVSAEWLCYLLAPWLAAGWRRIESGTVAMAGAVCAVAATKLALDALGQPNFTATIAWGALRIGGEFAAGALLCRAYRLGFARTAPWGAIAVASLALAFAFTQGKDMAFGIVGCFGIAVFALAHQRGPLAWLFSLRPVVFLGEISYSIYLVHWVVLRMAEYTFGLALRKAGGLPLLVGGILVLVLACSVVTYFAVERPTRRRLRAWVPA